MEVRLKKIKIKIELLKKIKKIVLDKRDEKKEIKAEESEVEKNKKSVRVKVDEKGENKESEIEGISIRKKKAGCFLEKNNLKKAYEVWVKKVEEF
ncbi:14013_t:CDS:2 [Dentiscutata erythropus]|uniref:14013_t:CDS:1 n=1 Tax=Dentiscutata erythropus TaxID=1348616 RepID=A0A9N9IVU3_9GLOM|nr:14013_t:CDS:2 [Dentiscutata erythropus]